MTPRRDLEQLPAEFDGLVPVRHVPEHQLRPGDGAKQDRPHADSQAGLSGA